MWQRRYKAKVKYEKKIENMSSNLSEKDNSNNILVILMNCFIFINNFMYVFTNDNFFYLELQKNIIIYFKSSIVWFGKLHKIKMQRK